MSGETVFFKIRALREPCGLERHGALSTEGCFGRVFRPILNEPSGAPGLHALLNCFGINFRFD